MNYEQLFAFVVFAEQLSFTRAAKTLHISQPALHVQIRKLGESVGRPLYRRDGRTLALTPEGRRLASYGREVRERGAAVLEELRGQPLTGPVVLASGQGAFLYLLGSAIRRFPKDRWPLRLLSMSASGAVEAVREAKVHLAVVAGDHAPPDLDATALRSVGQNVVVPSGHRFARAKRRTITPRDLGDEPLVLAPTSSPHRTMIEQLVASHGGRLHVAVEATGWDLMLQFARYGVGAAVVNDFCPAPRGMKAIPLEGAPRVTYWLLARKGLASEGVRVLRDSILETATSTRV